MPLQYGHAPGHIRDTFGDALWAFSEWNGGPEPTVGYESNYVERQIPISAACKLVRNCTDILPGHLYGLVEELFGENLRCTYAAAARAMLAAIKERVKATAS